MKILIVGSCVTDLFFKIENKDDLIINDDKVCLNPGSKIPIDVTDITIGGDGANISVGLKKLSIDATFYTFFGNDLFSKEIEERLKKEGINLIIKNGLGKGSLSLILGLKNDRIIFSHREVREHDFEYSNTLPEYLYLSSIGNHWEKAYGQVLEFVRKNSIPLIFTPGSPQLKIKNDIIYETLKSSKIAFINKAEAQKLLQWKNIPFVDTKDILSQIKELGPETVSVTDGENGAYALDKNNNFYYIKPFGENVVEKTGAGDAYTSGFLANHFMGNNIEESMRWGSINAYFAMQKVGAQNGLLTKEGIEKAVTENEKYKTEKL